MAPRRTTRSACSPDRWRPRSKAGPTCGYRFDRLTCEERGSHHCQPRAERVVRFFTELLVHTKGSWARQAFNLDPWQESDIIRPLFGEVVWSKEWKRYVRRYQVAGIVLGRKQGKSELAAGIVLYLLVGDDEEAAEIYGAAKDTKQAGKVAEVVERMRLLSPTLAARLKFNKNSRRIFDEKTGSYYEVITSDAKGELGANPHGFVLDEVLSQPDGSLWGALRSAAGTRTQPLFLLVTTETNDPQSFGAQTIDELERVQEQPSRAPHMFAYVRKTPMDADPWDEANWYHANPALGSFLSIEAIRQEALEARNEPTKENEFRQYRLNQRVQQVTRWMPLHLWDSCGKSVISALEQQVAGEPCFAGLDLASTTDLASWVLFFPGEPHKVLWRFYTPEAQISQLDTYTGGQASVWVRQGLLTATESDWIDYSVIHDDIVADKARYRLLKVGYDQKEATATAQFMQELGLEIEPVYQGFNLSASLKELMRLVKSEAIDHGGHPVARWNADSSEVRQNDEEKIKIVKPARNSSGKRIDGIAALANAINVWQWHREEATSEPFAFFA